MLMSLDTIQFTHDDVISLTAELLRHALNETIKLKIKSMCISLFNLSYSFLGHPYNGQG